MLYADLASVMLRLPLLLLLTVAGQRRNSTTNGAADTVGDAGAEVGDLAAGLLTLALGVLLRALALHALHAERVADRLLAGADRLVPRALLAIGVVGRDARARDGHTADAGAGVREVVAGGGRVLLLGAGVLKNMG